MTLYEIGLFLHIVGALGFFAALGLEWVGLLRLRRVATAEKALDAVSTMAPLARLYPLSGATILISGLYLTVVAWGAPAWIVVSLAVLVVLAVSGPSFNAPRMAAIERGATAEGGALSPGLRRRVRDPLLLAFHEARTAVALGVVFLMTVKPALGGAVVAIGIAAALGFLWGLPLWGRAPAEQPTT